jgi:nicotinate-nucleotide adenylyltransferase
MANGGKDMKVGIMGGTFDPIHMGHMIAAESAKDGLQLDEVWFMPTHQPPHKEQGPKASPGQRWDMVCRSIEGCAYFRAVDMELKRKGISYTFDTVLQLKNEYPDHDFYYIIGADMVQYLPHWQKIDEILEVISFIGLDRAGFEIEWEQIAPAIRRKVSMVTMPDIGISSTKIRSRRAAGQSIRYLIQEEVYHYIEVNHLYEA